MKLEDKIYLCKLAISARNIYIEQFELEDDDYIDYRAVRGKERALNNRIKKMSELTGVDKEKIYHIVVNSLLPNSNKYLNDLRDIGIPVPSIEEAKEYQKKRGSRWELIDKEQLVK